MNLNSTSIICDGCGLPASPAHIAMRVQSLELATRFRPIHIDVLFVALEPRPRLEDDFYRPPELRDFFDPFLSSLNILSEVGKQGTEANGHEADVSRLLEFQRRGYYLTYLSECPVAPEDANVARECISRLAATLVKRIRFNYKPKHIALVGTNLNPLIEVFQQAGMGPLLDFNQVASLTIPDSGVQ
ncbi:MAG: hypothetical protein JWN92_1480 [Candidatus Acidoferrum typicum]|nr:hypothetical protein [Candidatus Acidoferrum typicum]